ncbi:sigma-70 family RNA polymerase sigma factor [Microbacterium sp. 22242]|uniref:sigma-70 family RNA polymerase sigma factor n=1 Tax=Microbacterium sp. 22242 TaxID=3453896 RepID=UPI003F8404E8
MTDHLDSLPNDADEAPVRSDADLVLRSRSGDADAFAELWRRHYAAGISVARSITSTFDADDLVQEAFARIYQAIQKGGGPTGSFRAYLFTSIRNTAAGWGRARREAPADELDALADPSSTEEAANDALDQSLSAQAFRSLPARWQEVLWYSEIEQLKPAEIAPLLGMTAGATSQLAFRAREGLREAWIQAHLRTAEPGSICEWTIERLGAYARGNLGTRDRSKLEDHLGECARCLIVAAEAKEVSHRLALVLLPLVIGVGGSSAYLSMLRSGATPVVALAAMPSGVVQGAVVAGSGAAGAGAAGSAAGSGAAGSGGPGSGGIVAGFGALVGAGSLALVVAGAIVAAAVVPGLTADPASTSAPSASDKGDSSIVAQVTPPANTPAPQPAAPPAPDPAPSPHQDAPPKPPVSAPPVQAAPPRIPAGDVAAAPTETSKPTPPPVDPGTGTTDPGTGTTDPGTGTTDPGTGTTDPGTGTTDPGTPALPTTPPVIAGVGCALDLTGLPVTMTVTIPVEGVADTDVQATIGTAAQPAETITLNSSGTGSFALHLPQSQVNPSTTVTVAYVLDGQTGAPATVTLPPWHVCVLETVGVTPADGGTTTTPATTPATAPTTTPTTTTPTTTTPTTTTPTETTTTTTPADTTTPATADPTTTAPAAPVQAPAASDATSSTAAPTDGVSAPGAPDPATTAAGITAAATTAPATTAPAEPAPSLPAVPATPGA